MAPHLLVENHLAKGHLVDTCKWGLLGQFIVDEMTMNVFKMSVGQLSVGRMSDGKMVFDLIVFDQMSV